MLEISAILPSEGLRRQFECSSKLVWAAVVLLGMLVHNKWQLIAIRSLQYQLIAIWRLQYNLIAIQRKCIVKNKINCILG